MVQHEQRARLLDPTSITAKARDELLQIREANGGFVRPIDVVEFARNPETALHEYFDWDDSVAAEKWRLHQARLFIRIKLTVIQPSHTDKKYTIPLFTTLHSERGKKSYQLTTDIYDDPDKRAELLEEAKSALRTIRRKYQMLSELAEIWDSIDKVFLDEE